MTVTVGEVLALYPQGAAPTPSVSDSVSVGEDITANLTPIFASVSDATSVQDAANAVISALSVQVTDAVTLADAVNTLAQQLNIDLSDGVEAVEYLNLVISALQVSVTDSVTVEEYIRNSSVLLADFIPSAERFVVYRQRKMLTDQRNRKLWTVQDREIEAEV